MLAGLQIHINRLNAIIPESFIFIMDSTDRSFIYRSWNCPDGMKTILDLDQKKGVESLFTKNSLYADENDNHSYMIRRLSNHIFLGFFVKKAQFNPSRILDAKNFFQTIATNPDIRNFSQPIPD